MYFVQEQACIEMITLEHVFSTWYKPQLAKTKACHYNHLSPNTVPYVVSKIIVANINLVISSKSTSHLPNTF